MKDKTGRDLEQGQFVDIFISDIVTAYVIDIQENGVADLQGRVRPPTLVLQIAIPMQVPMGTNAPCYIVRESEKPKEEKARIM